MKYFRKTVLYRDLTGLTTAPPSATTDTAALTQAVTMWSNSQHKANEANEDERLTFVRERWGAHHCNELLKMCEASHEYFLSPSWTGMTGKKKDQND